MTNQTCGPLFLKCIKEFVTEPSSLKMFSAGHMVGQAEKIYLGACVAAMFRPSLEYKEWAMIAALKIATIYGLEVSVFDREEIKDEIWIHTSTIRTQIAQLSDVEVNSEEWHYLRGRLCGIPDYRIDPEFHLRKG